MKRRITLLGLLTGALSVLFACTDFNSGLEDGLAALGGPQLSSNEIDLSTPEQYDTEITVRSGEEWQISEKPDWVSVKSITATGPTEDSGWYTSPGWRVSIQIARNSGYNRSGTLSFRSASNTAAVSITQAGEKGEEPSENPSQVPVESITLSVESITLLEGSTAQLTATVLPENATDPSVLWSSSKESVATVDASGLVTALAEGTTTITAKAGDKTATCSVTVSKKVIPVTSVTLNKTSMTLDKGVLETLVATVKPDDASNKTVTWSSSDSSVASVDQNGKVTAISAGTATVTVTTVDGGKTASCLVTVTSTSSGTSNGHDWIDLGLPSGLKWATMNVGATKPEEYGDYFAWGETKPKPDYSWSTYKYELGTDDRGPFSKYVTKSNYGTVDNKTVLDLEDDAAHANWGGPWRIPTYSDWDELSTKCTWTWTTQNGVNGRKVTGPNGKSIFLPAAGFRSNTYLYDAGSNGNYWSSSIDTDCPYRACYVFFFSDAVYRSSYRRYYGRSVRPVSE